MSVFHPQVRRKNGGRIPILEICIFILIFLSLPVDVLNGLFLNKGVNVVFPSIYKCFVLISLLFYLFINKNRWIFLLFFCLCLLVMPKVAFSITDRDYSYFFADLSYAIKFFMPIFYALFLLTLKKQSLNIHIYSKIVRRFFYFSCIIVLCNILVGFLGYGFSVYRSANIGYKGLFFAGNELAAVFLALVGFILTDTYLNSKKSYIFISTIFLVFSIMVATKAAIFGTIFLSIFIPLNYLKDNKLFTKQILLLFAASFPLLYIYKYGWILLDKFGYRQKIEWTMEKKGILGLVFSGRDQYFLEAWNNISIEWDISSLLFGFGKYNIERNILFKSSTEIDPMDVFLLFGVIGLFFYFAFLCYIIFGKFRKISTYGIGVHTTSILMIFLSIFSGHVSFSGMLGPVLGMLIGSAFILEISRPKKVDITAVS